MMQPKKVAKAGVEDAASAVYHLKWRFLVYNSSELESIDLWC